MVVKEEEEELGKEVNGAELLWLDALPSCCQPVLKTSTRLHPFFNHQQTPEGRDVTPLNYVHSQSSNSY